MCWDEPDHPCFQIVNERNLTLYEKEREKKTLFWFTTKSTLIEFSEWNVDGNQSYHWKDWFSKRKCRLKARWWFSAQLIHNQCNSNCQFPCVRECGSLGGHSSVTFLASLLNKDSCGPFRFRDVSTRYSSAQDQGFQSKVHRFTPNTKARLRNNLHIIEQVSRKQTWKLVTWLQKVSKIATFIIIDFFFSLFAKKMILENIDTLR